MNASEHAPPQRKLAILLPAGHVRAWQLQLAAAIEAVPGVEAERCYVQPGATPRAYWAMLAMRAPALSEVPSGSALPPPSSAGWDVVVDLAGVRDPAPWLVRSVHGIWEVCDAQGTRLSEPLCCHAAICSGMGAELFLVRDRTDVLQTMRFHSEPDYRAALAGLYVHAAWLFRQGLRSLECGAAELVSTPFHPLPAPALLQRLWQAPLGRARAWWRRQRARWLSENWMIGIVDLPIHATLAQSGPLPVRWLGQRARRYYRADPFGVPDHPSWIYCEIYDYATGVAHLELVEMHEDGSLRAVHPAPLPLPVHASYPYLFKHEGRLFAMPETAALGRCMLYEVEAEGPLRFVATLLEGVRAADATLFVWEGRFWLAYTDIELGEFDNLCLCWAEALTGPWLPHEANPVKIDHRSSRPAGTPFLHEGMLYRPAQDCGGGYGRATVINRIIRCTPSCYEEEQVTRIAPDPRGLNPHGLHTLSAWGGRALVDGKRYQVNFIELARKLRRRLPGGRALAPDPLLSGFPPPHRSATVGSLEGSVP